MRHPRPLHCDDHLQKKPFVVLTCIIGKKMQSKARFLSHHIWYSRIVMLKQNLSNSREFIESHSPFYCFFFISISNLEILGSRRGRGVGDFRLVLEDNVLGNTPACPNFFKDRG